MPNVIERLNRDAAVNEAVANANAHLNNVALPNYSELEQQRDELLVALEKLVKLHHDWDKGSAYVQVAFYEKNKAAIAEARAAIAKATAQ